MLRSMGVSQWQLRRLLLAESVVIVMPAVALGLGRQRQRGLVLAWRGLVQLGSGGLADAGSTGTEKSPPP